MLLGKRRRPSMTRTTSIQEFGPDLEGSGEPPMPPDQSIPAAVAVNWHHRVENPGARRPCGPVDFLAEWKPGDNNRPAAAAPMVSSRGFRGNTGDFLEMAGIETAPFLRSCGLCMSRLNPGRDIFMYRGEIGFCSLECRQQLINQEERKEKCSFSSMRKLSAPATSAASESSGTGEKVAAT